MHPMTLTTSEINRRQFAISDEASLKSNSSINTPWKIAFPNLREAGYYSVFVNRCQKLSSDGLLDEETAKEDWLSILRDYENARFFFAQPVSEFSSSFLGASFGAFACTLLRYRKAVIPPRTTAA